MSTSEATKQTQLVLSGNHMASPISGFTPNPEEIVKQAACVTADFTPDCVKERDQQQTLPVLSSFFCSPEPTVLIQSTPDSYSQIFQKKKCEEFHDSSSREASRAAYQEQCHLNAIAANKLTFSAVGYSAWGDSGESKSTPGCTKQLLCLPTSQTSEFQQRQGTDQNSTALSTDQCVLSPKSELTTCNQHTMS